MTASWIDSGPPVATGPGLVRVASVSATPSAGFVGWLEEIGAALAVTTGDRLLTLGVDRGRLVLDEQRVDVGMGMAVGPDGALHVATRWQLHRLSDALAGARGPDGEDRLLVNQLSRTTGFVGVYDVAVAPSGRIHFTTALCNAVAVPGRRVNFDVVARPPFVSETVAEERCHLTGLALGEHGDLAYLTCASESDEPGGWRDDVADGGVVVDVAGGSVLARGLSLPTSPRLHGGDLFLTNAGTGELLRVDRHAGGWESVVRLPGLARGLALHDGWAVVGCSLPPTEGPYAGLPVAVDPPAAARHGLAVVDLRTGTVEHTVTFEAGSGDVHAVVVLSDTRRVVLRWQPNDMDGWFTLDRASALP